MKEVKIIDGLPTLFAVIAIIGLLTSTANNHSPGPELRTGQLLVVGGGLLTLFTALVSLLGLTRRKSPARKVVVLNTFWALAVIGTFVWTLFQLFQGFNHFTF